LGGAQLSASATGFGDGLGGVFVVSPLVGIDVPNFLSLTNDQGGVSLNVYVGIDTTVLGVLEEPQQARKGGGDLTASVSVQFGNALLRSPTDPIPVSTVNVAVPAGSSYNVAPVSLIPRTVGMERVSATIQSFTQSTGPLYQNPREVQIVP
jgi:hypothetical protein